MSEQNNDQEQPVGTCGPGCHCGASGSGRWRWIVGGMVLLVVGALVVRAVAKGNGSSTAPAPTGFAVLPAPTQTPAPAGAGQSAVADSVKELASLSELNTVAVDSVGAFVFLPGTNGTPAAVPTAVMQGAVKTMAPQLNGGKVGIFTLRADSPDYVQIASQMAVPGVLALVKGRGMAPVTGVLTQTKLIQGFATASSAGGCGTGGCGPTGCK